MTIREYMDRISGIYKRANVEYCERVKDLDRIERQLQTLNDNRALSPEGKNIQRQALYAERDRLKQDMRTISDQAKRAVKAERDACEKAYYSRFNPSADGIDTNALELLKSGILSDADLAHMADQFKGNPTMMRMVGKYANERDSMEMKALALSCNVSTTPHLDAIDALCVVGNACIGDAPLGGSASAQTMGQRFDELAQDAYAAAPDI